MSKTTTNTIADTILLVMVTLDIDYSSAIEFIRTATNERLKWMAQEPESEDSNV